MLTAILIIIGIAIYLGLFIIFAVSKIVWAIFFLLVAVIVYYIIKELRDAYDLSDGFYIVLGGGALIFVLYVIAKIITFIGQNTF